MTDCRRATGAAGDLTGEDAVWDGGANNRRRTRSRTELEVLCGVAGAADIGYGCVGYGMVETMLSGAVDVLCDCVIVSCGQYLRLCNCVVWV